MNNGLFFQVGYGGQGKAWYPSFIEAGLHPKLVLNSNGPSHKLAADQGYAPITPEELTNQLVDGSTIILLLPDRKISEFYKKYIQPSSAKVDLVMATGYAIYSKELTPAPQHQVHMFAPKAIGPKLREEILNAVEHESQKKTHKLKAAVSPSVKTNSNMALVQKALKFHTDCLVEVSFEQEAVGDLISEQLLLCGGLFKLFETTTQEMRKVGIPDSLIQEECGTELVLIATMLRDHGLEKTREAISDTAKQGAKLMMKELVAGGIDSVLSKRVEKIINKEFVKELNQQ